MTSEEFYATEWRPGMFGIYKGKTCPIESISFDERLIGLKGLIYGTDEPFIVRCENVTLVDENENFGNQSKGIKNG